MEFTCPLIAISDLQISIKFYKEVLGQKIKLDLGWNVAFDGGFAIQLNYEKLVHIEKESIMKKSHNFELYFEEKDFDGFLEHLKKFDNINYVHEPIKYDWQQRVVRIYDPDMHIIEIGEAMSAIAKRYLAEGMSIEETAKIIQHPVEFVKECI